jgi:hypothetical protein
MRRFWIIALLALCACGGKKHADSNVTPPPLLIDDRGTTMPLEKVVTHLSFRPYLPAAQALAYAVLPPLGDADNDRHRGIGIEYAAGNTAMLLSEWPKQKFAIAFGNGAASVQPCVPTHYSPQAVAWTTPGGLVMTLQPDGTVAPAAIDREARRVMRAGACR